MSGGPTDLSLMDTKEFKAYAKQVGDKLAKELLGKADDELKAVISSHTVSIEHATQLTKKTDAYQKAVEIKKDFEGALAEQTKPLKLALRLSAKVLNNRKNG